MSQNKVNEIWTRACKRLESLLRPDVYTRWIEVIHAEDLSGDCLTLSVDNDFYQTWLEDNYLSLIKDAVASVYDREVKVSFKVKPGSAPVELEAETKPARKKTLRERLSRKSRVEPPLNPKFCFEQFIVGPSNNFAHAASIAVAQAPAKAYNPLFIYGNTGLGKTHLTQAIGHYVLATSRANVCYTSSEALLNDYIDALQKNSLVQFRKKYRNSDLLLVDDIHFLAGKERLQEEFFHTFNCLFDAHKQIVMTSDRPASEITGLERRLVTRFEWGLVTELEPPDLETRIAILKHKLSLLSCDLSEDVILFLAENIRSDVRRLEGSLVRTVSYASLTNKEITIEGLKYLLRDTMEQEHLSQITCDAVQKAVSEYYDIRLADMTSNRRPRSIAHPRQVAMYLCRRVTRSSFPDIAAAFGKTHATIVHAYKSVDNRMDVDKSLREDVLKIAKKLGKKL